MSDTERPFIRKGARKLVTAEYPPEDHFLRQIGLVIHDVEEQRAAFVVGAHEEIALRPLVMGSLAAGLDYVLGSVALPFVGTDWLATSQLSIQAPGLHAAEAPVWVDCQLLDIGRAVVFADARLSASGGTPLGGATLTYARLPGRRSNEAAARHVLVPGTAIASAACDVPVATTLDQYVGITRLRVDGTRSELTFPLREALSNGSGFLHGGVMATAVEVAAGAFGGDGRVPAWVESLHMQYVSGGRAGPFVVHGALIGTSGAGQSLCQVVQLVLRDQGHGGRLVANALATVRVATRSDNEPLGRRELKGRR